MPHLNVWLVRHGQSANNAGQPTWGNAEVPLTELGIEQSRAVAARIDRQPALLVVSPFLRSRSTVEWILARWPQAPFETWPIQEFTYLSLARCLGSTVSTRQALVDAYWQRCDPAFVDGPEAESFSQFMERVYAFHQRLLSRDGDFVVAVGHGQFFSAYLFALAHGFSVTPEWMKSYRAAECAKPITNGEIIALGESPQPPHSDILR